MEHVFACLLNSWPRGTGDPTLLGWLTVALYVAAAALCFSVLAGRRFYSASPKAEAAFWFFAGAMLTALALNKQLDLQTYLTSAGRCIARHQGWYRERRMFQIEFITALAVAAAVGLAAAAFALRKTLRYTGLPLLGLFFVTGFVLIRAVSLHHIDRLLGATVATERLRWLLELPGPALVAASALWLLAKRGRDAER